ncbi:polysaccharide deacetylase family protein [Azotosporobacter soli]|uniref:polysaccharide deacetylase family protein n=1 Tax=Azotosporobacter soli TaxID=3055040 RepID=UPI0031FEDCF6
MLIIRCDASYPEERAYIYDVIFREFWGISYRVAIEDRTDIVIACSQDAEKEIRLADVFFQTPATQWMTDLSLPMQPLEQWEIMQPEIAELVVDDTLPVIFGYRLRHDGYVMESKEKIQLGIDVFGAAFLMLTRYEEVVRQDYDEHHRFAAKSSLAFQEGFLARPIINEYLEILWWCIKKIWPTLQRKNRRFKMVATHDVDFPFSYAFRTLAQTGRSIVADVLKRQDPGMAIRRLARTYQVRKGNYLADENYTFDTIMDISEANEIKSCFYFMTSHSHASYDTFYPLNHPLMQALMKRISERGHEIGLHPSYESFQDGTQIKKECAYLKQACAGVGIELGRIGGRQHYLRWSPDTWQHYEDAGLAYDTSVSYADHIGFRCGICFEYPVFNLKKRRMLALRERPLLVMECSALDKQYMGLSCAQAKYEMSKLKETVRKYNGDFVLLWHNDRLSIKTQLAVYKSLFDNEVL